LMLKKKLNAKKDLLHKRREG